MSFITEIKRLAQDLTLTNREIAEQLGCSRRTVRRVAGPNKERFVPEKTGNPKILLLDIETAPMEVYVWQLFKQVVQPHQMIKDWCVLCWAAKWLNDPEIIGDRLDTGSAFVRDDSPILRGIWTLLDEADIVIGHYLSRFDVPKLNARFMALGFGPPSPYQIIDTKKEIGKVSWPSSLKLDFLNKAFKLDELKGHSGFWMWQGAVTGDEECLRKLYDYNKQDVFALEDLYMYVRPWIKMHANLGLYVEADGPVCPNCASEDLTWKGHYYTSAGKYASFRCNNCGAIGRSRFTDYPKDKRRSLVLPTAR